MTKRQINTERVRQIDRHVEVRVWGEHGFRLFLSHKASEKKRVAALKAGLAVFGISGFVAHESIKPTLEWQTEIENALLSMDAFAALMTESFHDSDWTDQEVGYALGLGVPTIALRLGTDPYGFLGKFQALTSTWEDAPLEIARLLIRQPRMIDAYIRAVTDCVGFDNGNLLAKTLPDIDVLTSTQVNRLLDAFNENGQARGSFGFNGSKPHQFGRGLAAELMRITGRRFKTTATGRIREET